MEASSDECPCAKAAAAVSTIFPSINRSLSSTHPLPATTRLSPMILCRKPHQQFRKVKLREQVVWLEEAYGEGNNSVCG